MTTMSAYLLGLAWLLGGSSCLMLFLSLAAIRRGEADRTVLAFGVTVTCTLAAASAFLAGIA